MKKEPKNIEEIISAASPEAERLFLTILNLERDKLYMSKPHGIIDDIVRAFKKEIGT